MHIRTCEVVSPGSFVISVTLTNTSRAVTASTVDRMVAADASQANVTFVIAEELSTSSSTTDFKEALSLGSHPVTVMYCSSSCSVEE